METKKLSDIIDKTLNIHSEDKVYDRADIFELFKIYLSGEINESSFENSYYLMYTRDGTTNISTNEKLIPDNLGDIIHRFSEFEEDQRLGAYTTKQEFKDSVIDSFQKLNSK